MSGQLDKMIKALQDETTDLKTAKRLSTSTLETITKTIQASGVMRKQQSPSGTGMVIFPAKAAMITLGTTATNPAPFGVSISGEEVRNYRIFGFNNNGAMAVIVSPDYCRALDLNMPTGDKTVNFTVNITTTDDITLTASQVDFEEAR